MSRPAISTSDDPHTIWQRFVAPPDSGGHSEGNPSHRVSAQLLGDFYVGPLIKKMEQELNMTRPEWIVLFCLTQRSGLSAQQISNVTGRAKTSISAAVIRLQRKRLISRSIDTNDGRRRVLQITEAGQRMYARILASLVAREAQMVACLSRNECGVFLQAGSWRP